MGRDTGNDAARDLLIARGADGLEHPGGTLLAHLDRVEARLADWDARDELRLAGLCHAFYGTDGFAGHLLPLEERGVLAAAIGEEAEALVYFYASCDREFSYEGVGNENGLFRDRFTGGTFTPTERRRRDFAELTAANELDVLRENRELWSRHGGGLLKLFTRWRSLLSEPAFEAARELLTLRGAEREAFLRGLERGEVRAGVVSQIERFGAFVELGGLDGMVSVAELSWSHVDAISDVVGEGQEVTVEVLDVDMDRERIALSLKALEPDPMAAFARAGFAGIRAGTVTRVLPFGVCVKVAPGVEGLVHEKDLGGLAPREGDELSVEVTSVNLVTRRVALRLRG
ncbi:DUF6817 domain-containing protein [Streptomyces sp. Je 1-79]|uniref:DUF6817 domain-containing protein n=1 Tax=Streptomyces sp. Je 1-79 TaxID=2943847 RepID=UPI0027E3F819|nr:S1 RNA-binding domain-containing protein [Streptomyces sp. Je 1-79]